MWYTLYIEEKLYKDKQRRYDYEYLPLLPGERRYDDLARALRSSMYGTGSSLVESIDGESEWRLGTRSWTWLVDAIIETEAIELLQSCSYGSLTIWWCVSGIIWWWSWRCSLESLSLWIFSLEWPTEWVIWMSREWSRSYSRLVEADRLLWSITVKIESGWFGNV